MKKKFKLLPIITMLLICTLLFSSCKNNDPYFIIAPELPDYSDYIIIGDYKNLTYTIPNEYKITDDKVDALMQAQISNLAERKEITDRPVQNKDEVIIKYTGTINGKPFTNGSTPETGRTVTIGNMSMPSDYENAIIGMSLNETKDIKINFPESYIDDTLRGQTVNFETTILSITELTYPELTDEIISKNTIYTSVEQFRNETYQNLKKLLDSYIETSAFDQIIEQLKNTSEIKSYPTQLVTDLVEESVATMTASAANSALDIEDFIKNNTEFESLDDYKKYMTKIAENYVFTRIVISEIAKNENLTATDEEFENYKNKFASEHNFESTNNINLYYSDSDLLIDMLTSKIKTWLISQATCTNA